MTVLQPGVADVSVQLTLAGFARPSFITFGVDPTATDPTVVANDVKAALSTTGSLTSILDNSTTLGPVTVRLGVDGGEPLVGVSTTPPSAGLRSLTSLPANTSVLVHKRTALGGRRNRGRWYIPWSISDSFVDEAGVITPGEVTTIQTAMTNTWIALNTANVPMVILHSIGGSPVPAATPVTGLLVDPLIATQRRRLGR